MVAEMKSSFEDDIGFEIPYHEDNGLSRKDDYFTSDDCKVKQHCNQ